MADKVRQGFRFAFGGMNTRNAPDALPPNKYPYAQNIRAVGDQSVRTRPGLEFSFTTASHNTDMRAYCTIGTDNKPRLLVHNDSGAVFLDNGVQKAVVGNGGPFLGASMIPYRPNQSPQSWMYIGNSQGYRKLSAPDGSNNVTSLKVGIAEPQWAPNDVARLEVCPDGFQYNEFTATAASWAVNSTPPTGAPADATRNLFSDASTDTVVAAFADPASVSPAAKTRYSVQITQKVLSPPFIQYQVGETVTFSGTGLSAEIEDVVPPINSGVALTIQAIYYFSGATGSCIIVPSQAQVDPTVPVVDALGQPVAAGTPLPGQMAGMRRGSLVQLGGSEVVLVLNVTTGPQGGIAFECSTTGAFAAGAAIIGIPAIVCASTATPSGTITASQINSALTAGIATLTQTLATNPFNLALGSYGTPQQDDLVHVSLLVNTPANVTELKLLFDVGDGTFTQNVLYYAVRVSALQAAFANSITQLTAVQTVAQQDLVSSLPGRQYSIDSEGNPVDTGAIEATQPSASTESATGSSQWTEVIFAISDLTRIGDDQTKTLANCVSVQILANVSGAVNLSFGSLWVGGGGQPDVGESGAPYFYRVRPRSAATGAKGNPSESTRYGVLPRRQRNIVSLPSASYDAQIDTWDVFRYGGTTLSWRLIGAATSNASTFIDNYFDDSARGGEALEFDNFEPWPSVDVPFQGTVGDGNVTAITVYGTAIKITASTFPATITKWLPGTLITLNGQATYTLWNRPVAVSGGYLFRIQEDAGAPSVTVVSVTEPNVANQNLPYLWGPDANGVIFGVGDPLRPGALYSSKQFAPDATPNNIYDLTPPSEPLLGGDVIDGLAIVASSSRWWALQRAFGTPNRWFPIEMPAGRGLAAPWGHCTDGKFEYFWAKDGIYLMSVLGYAVSITDADLYNLFPHDGVAGMNVTYAGKTVYAPDYKYAGQFRLSVIQSILRAHYLDSTGTHRTLSCDLSLTGAGAPRLAWAVEAYGDGIPIDLSSGVEQPAGTLLTSTLAYAQEYLAAATGKVYISKELTSDDSSPISCALATFEWDGGDLRAFGFFTDIYTDTQASAVITVQPLSFGANVGLPTSFGGASTRVQRVVSLAGGQLIKTLGMLFTWNDSFPTQTDGTILYIWELEYFPKPIIESDAATDWEDGGVAGAKYMQGLVLEADTFGLDKRIKVRDAETLGFHDIQGPVGTNIINHNGQSVIAYSFATPFVAHRVRIEPQDSGASAVSWRQAKPFRRDWVFEPTPEKGRTWQTQPTTHGLTGFHHIRKVVMSYVSTAAVTLTITAIDGTSPAVITLPSTGGVPLKVEFVPTFNKGRMYTYAGVSAAPWAPYLDKCEIHVGAWERQGNYSLYVNLGGVAGDQARV